LAEFRGIEFFVFVARGLLRFNYSTTCTFTLHFTVMAASTRSKLSIPDDRPKSEHQFFFEAKKQLLEEKYLLLTSVPKDFALPLIEGLDSDPAIGSEGKYRYGIP